MFRDFIKEVIGFKQGCDCLLRSFFAFNNIIGVRNDKALTQPQRHRPLKSNVTFWVLTTSMYSIFDFCEYCECHAFLIEEVIVMLQGLFTSLRKCPTSTAARGGKQTSSFKPFPLWGLFGAYSS
jgi:hypothetical protein